MAGRPDDSDASLEWEPDAAPTVLDADVVEELALESVTAPHATLSAEVDRAFEAGREQGFRSGYPAGHEDALGSLRNVLLARGLTNEETAHLVLLVRSRQTAL